MRNILLSLMLLAGANQLQAQEKADYMFSAGFCGTLPFYDLPTIDQGDIYKRDKPGISYGIMVQANIWKGFYLGSGLFYSRASYTFDTTGFTTPWSGFLMPPVVNKEMGYLDHYLILGKDFSIIKNRLSIGLQGGMVNGYLKEGANYISGFYPVPIYSGGPEKQFNQKTFGWLGRLDISVQLTDRFSMQVYSFLRSYDYIDYAEYKYKSQNSSKPPKFTNYLLNQGVGIRYHLGDRKKLRLLFKKG